MQQMQSAALQFHVFILDDINSSGACMTYTTAIAHTKCNLKILYFFNHEIVEYHTQSSKDTKISCWIKKDAFWALKFHQGLRLSIDYWIIMFIFVMLFIDQDYSIKIKQFRRWTVRYELKVIKMSPFDFTELMKIGRLIWRICCNWNTRTWLLKNYYFIFRNFECVRYQYWRKNCLRFRQLVL